MPLPDIQRLLMDDVYHFLKSDALLADVALFRSRTPLARDEGGNPVAGDGTMIEDAIDQALAGITESEGQTIPATSPANLVVTINGPEGRFTLVTEGSTTVYDLSGEDPYSGNIWVNTGSTTTNAQVAGILAAAISVSGVAESVSGAVITLSRSATGASISLTGTSEGDVAVTGGGSGSNATQSDPKAGLAVLVMMPDVMDEDSADSPTPLAKLELKIRVIENRLINEGTSGTGISATAMANHVWAVLHYRPIGGRGNPLPAPRVIEESTLPNDTRAADVTLFYPAQGLTAPVRCAMPTVTEAAGQITLACATSGASIYYTASQVADLAGYPGSGNASATLYSAPFTLAAGTWMLRAGAQKTNHSPSWDLCAEITVE
jgi:hypothetical protein